MSDDRTRTSEPSAGPALEAETARGAKRPERAPAQRAPARTEQLASGASGFAAVDAEEGVKPHPGGAADLGSASKEAEPEPPPIPEWARQPDRAPAPTASRAAAEEVSPVPIVSRPPVDDDGVPLASRAAAEEVSPVPIVSRPPVDDDDRAPRATRPPRASERLIAPKAPPTSPELPAVQPRKRYPPLEDAFVDISEPGRRLALRLSVNLPTFSSFEFSLNLTDLLAEYWRACRHLLLTDEHGQIEQDYVLVAERAHLLQDSGPTSPRETVLDAVRRVADELDADKVPYYAHRLKGRELHFVQAVHDLVVALLHYKLAPRVEDETDRLVMLTSASGAMGCIQAALHRFGDLDVPGLISSYAEVLELKINADAGRLA